MDQIHPDEENLVIPHHDCGGKKRRHLTVVILLVVVIVICIIEIVLNVTNGNDRKLTYLCKAVTGKDC